MTAPTTPMPMSDLEAAQILIAQWARLWEAALIAVERNLLEIFPMTPRRLYTDIDTDIAPTRVRRTITPLTHEEYAVLLEAVNEVLALSDHTSKTARPRVETLWRAMGKVRASLAPPGHPE